MLKNLLALLGGSHDGSLQNLDAQTLHSKGIAYLRGPMNLGGNFGIVGTPQDFRRAMACFKAASDKGHAGAMYQLAGMIANGQGCPADSSLAVRWMQAAAECGDIRAQSDLGLRLEQQGQPDEALTWQRRAAAQGDQAATSAVARLTASMQRHSAGRFYLGHPAHGITPSDLGKATIMGAAALSRSAVRAMLDQAEGSVLFARIRSDPKAAEDQVAPIHIGATVAYVKEIGASEAGLDEIWTGLSVGCTTWLPSPALLDRTLKRIHEIALAVRTIDPSAFASVVAASVHGLNNVYAGLGEVAGQPPFAMTDEEEMLLRATMMNARDAALQNLRQMPLTWSLG